MTPRPPHPSKIPTLDVTTHRAEIRTSDGWWFRYVVHRAMGCAIPENSTSRHRTLARARRAADRWCAKTSVSELVQRVEPLPQPIRPSPMRGETRG